MLDEDLYEKYFEIAEESKTCWTCSECGDTCDVDANDIDIEKCWHWDGVYREEI